MRGDRSAPSQHLIGALDATSSGEPYVAIYGLAQHELQMISPTTGQRLAPVSALSSYASNVHIVDGREDSRTGQVIALSALRAHGMNVQSLFPGPSRPLARAVDGTSGTFVDLDGDDRPELVTRSSDTARCALNVYDGQTFEQRGVIAVPLHSSRCHISGS